MHCIFHPLIQSSKRFTIIITQTDHLFLLYYELYIETGHTLYI